MTCLNLYRLLVSEDGCLLSCCAVNFYRTTRRNSPEDSHLHTRRCENLKSHSCTYPLYVSKRRKSVV
jgi:hypothetical protein